MTTSTFVKLDSVAKRWNGQMGLEGNTLDIVSDIAGHLSISAPSPSSSFAYDRRPEAPVGYMTQEDGCLFTVGKPGFKPSASGRSLVWAPIPSDQLN